VFVKENKTEASGTISRRVATVPNLEKPSMVRMQRQGWTRPISTWYQADGKWVTKSSPSSRLL
jgi:hypothetical protein